MSSIFDHQSFTFFSHSGFDDNLSRVEEKLDALVLTGANAISLVGRTMQTDPTGSSFGEGGDTTDLVKLGAVIDEAHSRGLEVTLTPVIDLLDYSSRTKIVPDNINAWFANYKEYLMDYAELAQEKGVEMLSLGTEMSGVITPDTAHLWEDLIASVRDVYDGALTYQAEAYDVGQVTFWDLLDVISIDAYVPVSSDDDPTVESVVAAWDTVPTDPWQAERFGWKSPVDYFRSLAVAYDKPIQFGELGYRNLDGAGMNPGGFQDAGIADPAEQKVLYEGFFQVFSKETSWFQGVNLFDWTTTYDTGTVYNLQYSAALDIIEQWYKGSDSLNFDATLMGTIGDDALAGASGNDIILGGAGSDILLGGAGNDLLIGGGKVLSRTGKLEILATGTSASGVDALMRVSINGKIVGTFDVIDDDTGISQAFTLDLPKNVPITSLSISFINDAYIDGQDRNLFIQGVTVDGLTLDAGMGTNSKAPGTFLLKWNGSLAFDLTPFSALSGVTSGEHDVLNGGEGVDTASYADATSAITVDLLDSGNQSVTRNGGFDTLISVENIIGSDFNDTMIGNNDSNIFDGGAGDDTLAGGLGNDLYLVDSTRDQVSENIDGGYDIVMSAGSYKLAAGQEIEGLELAGKGRGQTMTGNEFDNTIVGNGKYNILDGGAGADTMIGGGGNDTYQVDNIHDAVIEAHGGGWDTVVTSVNFTLSDEQKIEKVALSPATGRMDLDLAGNRYRNFLVGNDGDNRLIGNGGGDRFTGGAGADIFIFDEDSYSGSSTGKNTITDFSDIEGDKIELRHITAIGSKEFAGSDDVFAAHDMIQLNSNSRRTLVQVDTDSDGHSDFIFKVKGVDHLNAEDFLL